MHYAVVCATQKAFAAHRLQRLQPELQCTIALQWDSALSQIEENLSIAKALGLKADHREPDVFIGSNELERARVLLDAVNPARKPVVIFSTQPSGNQPTEWHGDRWSAVLTAVIGARPAATICWYRQSVRGNRPSARLGGCSD